MSKALDQLLAIPSNSLLCHEDANGVAGDAKPTTTTLGDLQDSKATVYGEQVGWVENSKGLVYSVGFEHLFQLIYLHPALSLLAISTSSSSTAVIQDYTLLQLLCLRATAIRCLRNGMSSLPRVTIV